MIKEIVFDAVFDAQKSFRLLLDAFSHPGTIYSFDHFEFNQPNELYKSNVIIALSLFDNNISFHASSSYNLNVENYLHLNASAKIENIETADYVFLNGQNDISNLIDQCKIGDLLYPEKNATIILAVNTISNDKIQQFDCQINLSGPGIQTTKNLYIKGLNLANLETIKSLNAEFPLGVDLILTDAFEKITVIPRSIQIEIIQNI
jgi:alpha-D-ribose 1-methylphosphonate 5-triphosphate synthase subunit PhnH